MRKETWKEFKFSETVLLGEDKEFASRILVAGYSIIYEPSAAVYHAHDLSLREAFSRSIDAGIALKQGVEDLPRSKAPFIGFAVDYLVQEWKYLLNINKLIWFPYCVIYELARFTGTLLGKSGLFTAQSIKTPDMSK